MALKSLCNQIVSLLGLIIYSEIRIQGKTHWIRANYEKN